MLEAWCRYWLNCSLFTSIRDVQDCKRKEFRVPRSRSAGLETESPTDEVTAVEAESEIG